jgi:hypothetical protein
MSGQNSTMRHTLERIRATLRRQKLALSTTSKSKPIGDPRQREFWTTLGLQETELRRILRNLQQKAANLERERDHLWRIPRDLRYSARQSIDDREAVTLDLVELAEITLRELLDFGGDAAIMKVGDWEKLGQDGAEFVTSKLDKANTHTVIQQLQKGPAFTVENAHPGLGLDHLAPLIGLLIAYIASKRRKT